MLGVHKASGAYGSLNGLGLFSSWHGGAFVSLFKFRLPGRMLVPAVALGIWVRGTGILLLARPVLRSRCQRRFETYLLQPI